MRDCTEFHSKCGPLGPFLNNAAIQLYPMALNDSGLYAFALICTPNPIEAGCSVSTLLALTTT